MKTVLQGAFWCLILVGCTLAEVDTPEKLQAFIKDEGNGLMQNVIVGDVSIMVSYRPTDLMIHQEAGGVDIDTATIRRLRNKYAGYHYFIVSLSRNEKEALHQAQSMDEYSELVQTLSFRMGEYVNLTNTKQDTISLSDFMLDRTYGLGTATNLLFVFNKEKSKGQEWIQVNLNEFGLGIGNQRFRFRMKDLESVPKLKFVIK